MLHYKDDLYTFLLKVTPHVQYLINNKISHKKSQFQISKQLLNLKLD